MMPIAVHVSLCNDNNLFEIFCVIVNVQIIRQMPVKKNTLSLSVKLLFNMQKAIGFNVQMEEKKNN